MLENQQEHEQEPKMSQYEEADERFKKIIRFLKTVPMTSPSNIKYTNEGEHYVTFK